MVTINFSEGYSIEIVRSAGITTGFLRKDSKLVREVSVNDSGCIQKVNGKWVNVNHKSTIPRSLFETTNEFYTSCMVDILTIGTLEDPDGLVYDHVVMDNILRRLIADSLDGLSLDWFPTGKTITFDHDDYDANYETKLIVDGKKYKLDYLGVDERETAEATRARFK